MNPILLRIYLVFLGLGFLLTGTATAQNPEPVITPWTIKQKRYVQTLETPTTQINTFEERDRLDETDNDDSPQESQRNTSQKTATHSTAQGQTLSAIENAYNKRLKTDIKAQTLRQFGYDLFSSETLGSEKTKSGSFANVPPPSGTVQDDFILGAGDEIEIMFTGQRTDRKRYHINDRGLILIEDFPPIPATGRSIANVRLSIETAAQNLYNIQAHISLASVRQIGVLVIGHVNKPGRQTLTVFHTIMDALLQADGIQKSGSLRQIKLIRGGNTVRIDLYNILQNDTQMPDLTLRDGDRIIIPTIGPTTAVAGAVKTPGIFEIPSDAPLPFPETLALAGGTLSSGKNRVLKLWLDDTGREQTQEIRSDDTALFHDGSILLVTKGSNQRTGGVELKGHTRRPGLYSLDGHKKLSNLLSSETILGPDIYPLIGMIKRWDKKQFSHAFLPFAPYLVMHGQYDRTLHDGDQVYLFSNQDIVQTFSQTQGKKDNEHKIASLTKSFLSERAVYVRGAVRKPGYYPVSDGLSLANILAVSGGLALKANITNIEVTSSLSGKNHQANGRSGTRRTRINLSEIQPEDVPVGSGDSIRINHKTRTLEESSVLIMGEVLSPGRYDLLAGDQVSDLIERAGGFTPQAYPEGAIFSRKSERRAEEARFKAQARDMRRSIAAALEQKDKDIDSGKISQAMALAEELERAQGVGRITIEADLGILKTDPELDMILENDDRLFIPKRSLNVRVSGEALSPANLQFRKDKNPIDYIHEAGGFSYHADKDRTFVLYPDGSAQPLHVSAWSHSAVFIPPGSTIIIPRDPEPFDFVESFKDISQILSNLAITGIFIDDVREN